MDSILNTPVLGLILDHALADKANEEFAFKQRAWELSQVCTAFHRCTQKLVKLRPERLRVHTALSKQTRLTYNTYLAMRLKFDHFLGVSTFRSAQRQLERFSTEERLFLNDDGQLMQLSTDGVYSQREVAKEELNFHLNQLKV